MMTMIYGSGFPEGDVTLTVKQSGGDDVILTSVTVDGSMAFSVEAEITLSPGMYSLVATPAMGPAASTPLKVVEEK